MRTPRYHLHTTKNDSAVVDAPAPRPHSKSEARQRKIAMPPRHFAEAETPSAIKGTNAHPQQQLLGCASCRIKAREEIFCCNNAFSATRRERNFGSQANDACGQLGRWIRQRQTATERAAVADRSVSHVL